MRRLRRERSGIERLGPIAGALLLGALGASCAGPATQLVVVVDTNLGVPVEMDQVEVIVTGPSMLRTGSVQSLIGASAPAFPLTLGVSPAGESLGPVDVVAVGTLGGAEVVRTAARVTLVEGETRTLTLYLVRGCVGRACGPGLTCGPGGCTSPARADLPAWDGIAPPYVMTDPCDGQAWDEDGDGSGSIECGGTDCADTNPARNVDAVEDCDGIDNDCDNRIDPDCSCSPNGLVESCDTSCGSIGQRTCVGGTFGACEIPVESCDGMDDDCDGLVDEGFDYVAVGETRITETLDDSSNPRVVGGGGRWAIVWAEQQGTNDLLHAAAVSSTGTVVLPATALGERGLGPDITWNGTVYGVAWRRPEVVSCGVDCVRTDRRLMVATLEPSGFLRAGPTRLEDAIDADPRVRVIWDGTAFRTSYHDGDLYVRSFDPAAVEVDARVLVSGNDDDVSDIAWSGSRYGFAWARGDTVYFASGDGLGSAIQTTVEVSNQVREAALDWTGEGYLVGWLYRESGGIWDGQDGLDVSVVDATGVPSGTTTNLSTTVAGSGFAFQNPDPPTIRAGGGQVLVAWADQRDGDQEIYFARLAPDGTVVQAASRLTSAVGAADGASLAFDGSGFAAAWHDERDGNQEVYFSRIGCGP